MPRQEFNTTSVDLMSAYLKVDLLDSSILSSLKTMHDAVELRMPQVDFVLGDLILEPMKKSTTLE